MLDQTSLGSLVTLFASHPGLPKRQEESCGIVYRNLKSGEYVLVDVPNASDKPIVSFSILKRDEALADEQMDGYEQAAYWHTHLGRDPADPSIHDVRSMPDGKQGLVYHADKRTLTLYDFDGFQGKVEW